MDRNGAAPQPPGQVLTPLLLRRRRYGASHGVGPPSTSCQDLREPTPCPRRARLIYSTSETRPFLGSHLRKSRKAQLRTAAGRTAASRRKGERRARRAQHREVADAPRQYLCKGRDGSGVPALMLLVQLSSEDLGHVDASHHAKARAPRGALGGLEMSELGRGRACEGRYGNAANAALVGGHERDAAARRACWRPGRCQLDRAGDRFEEQFKFEHGE